MDARRASLRLRRSRAFVTFGLFVLCANPLNADGNPSAADDHYSRGLKFAREEDYDAAVEQFERAHALSPHFAVLYNLGQAHALAGRPVEAASILRRYLNEGGEAIPRKRRQQVEETITKCLKKTGILSLSIEPSSALVSVNGVELSPGSSSVRLVSGRHVVVAQAPGHLPRALQVTVTAGGEAHVKWKLDAIPPAPAWLDLTCDVPGVEVTLGPDRAGTTPLSGPILVAPGVHAIRFARSGYRSREKSVVAISGQRVAASCDLAVDPHATSAAGARVMVTPSESDAEVFVDGVRFHGGPLPQGLHRIDVRRPGFELWSRTLALPPGRTTVVSAVLEPSDEYANAYRHRAKDYRLYALVGAASGVALAGMAGALFAYSAEQFEVWQSDRDRLDADLFNGNSGASEVERSRDLSQRAARIQAMDDAALVMTVVGSAVVLLSAGVWIFGPDPERYDKTTAATASSPFSWRF